MADLKDVAVLISALFGAGGLATAIATVIGARASAHKEHAQARSLDKQIIAEAAAEAATAFKGVIDELENALGRAAIRIKALEDKLETMEATIAALESERAASNAERVRCEAMFESQIRTSNRHIEELDAKIAQLENEKAASEQRECELLARMERDKAAQARREAELIARIDELSQAIERFKVDRDRDVNELHRQIEARDRRIAELSGGL